MKRIPTPIVATTLMFVLLSSAGALHAQHEGPLAWMGVRLADLNEETARELGLDSTDGVLIVSVIDDTPAKAAGFAEHDVIRKMDQSVIRDSADLRTKMRESKPGQVMKITVIRQTKPRVLTITLGTRPPPKPLPPDVPN
jgi:serine protease Do